MQKLILFENVLNPDAVLASEMFQKELGAMSKYIFGEYNCSVESPENIHKLHDWCSSELDKSIRRDSGPVYPVKTSFEDIKNECSSDKCSGPLKIWFFEPNWAINDQIILITCHWTDGLFSNDHYVIGMVATDFDLGKILEWL